MLVALTLFACGGKGVEPELEPEPKANHEEGDLVITLPGGAKMAFIRIEPGTYRMGGTVLSDPRNTDALPVHQVTLTQPFYLGKYTVTRRQWASVMGVNQLPDMPDYAKGHDYPVVNLTWEDSQAFIHRLNELAGQNLYALPTEAQWEYACRAGAISRWSYDNATGPNSAYMWYGGNSDNRIHPVGLKLPNPWGLYDIHGNVWEWVYDWFSPYTDEPKADPAGPNEQSPRETRIRRGGSALNIYETCCVTRYHAPNYPLNMSFSGFRVARKATDIMP